jgi:hypothetical protein
MTNLTNLSPLRLSFRFVATLALVAIALVLSAGAAAAAPPSGLSREGRAAYATLAGTDTFAEERVGYRGELSANVAAFRVLLKEKAARAAFTALDGETSAAARLYALAGLWHTDRHAFGMVAQELGRSKARVKVEAGCLTAEKSIAELVDAGAGALRLEPGERVIDALKAGRKGALDIAHGGYPVSFAG